MQFPITRSLPGPSGNRISPSPAQARAGRKNRSLSARDMDLLDHIIMIARGILDQGAPLRSTQAARGAHPQGLRAARDEAEEELPPRVAPVVLSELGLLPSFSP